MTETNMVDATIESVLDAYIECALWSSMDESDDSGGKPMDENYGASDIDPVTLETMRKDCSRFMRDNRVMIETLDDLYPNWFTRYSTEEMIGYDFWFTRNGHEAGFWDGNWPGSIGEHLSRSCKSFGEFTLYVGDDGKIHGC